MTQRGEDAPRNRGSTRCTALRVRAARRWRVQARAWGAARGHRTAALSIRRMGRSAARHQCRPSAVGGGGGAWACRARSSAASVSLQRRGGGGGAWAGQAGRRQCRPSAVGEAGQVAQQRGAGTAAARGGAAVAPGGARWRGGAAESWRWRSRAVGRRGSAQSIATSRPQPRAAQEQRSRRLSAAGQRGRLERRSRSSQSAAAGRTWPQSGTERRHRA